MSLFGFRGAERRNAFCAAPPPRPTGRFAVLGFFGSGNTMPVTVNDDLGCPLEARRSPSCSPASPAGIRCMVVNTRCPFTSRLIAASHVKLPRPYPLPGTLGP